MTAIQNRYDFVLFFDVTNGNPNGDPDGGNLPRVDQETNVGLVTDVCLKRKIRNYVEAAKEGTEGYRIYVREDATLEKQNDDACKALGITKGVGGIEKVTDDKLPRKIRDYMCQNFYDIRAFGAVMTSFTKIKGFPSSCNHVRGPVQLGFARSVDPILPQEITITRLTLSTEKESDAKKGSTMMGHKYIVPYGLYRVEGYVSANLAKHVTGFDENDLQLLWQALANMFEIDHSATRGNMSARKLIVFKHASELGNAPASLLFDRIQATRVDAGKTPRQFADYRITVDKEKLPEGVEIQELL